VSDATTTPAAPRVGAAAADRLLEPWFACLRERLPGLRVFDCHTHLGLDPDGSCQTADELLDALDVVDGRAVTFSLSEPDGYPAANDRMLAAADASGGRLIAYCRVNPEAGGLAEAQRCLDAGARGIKLHPRAERFALSDRAVHRIAALAAERRAPIIVHAGRGIPSLGRDALDLAARHPDAPLILAHAAICDLAWIWREAPAHRNLFFDTAWWNTTDQLALLALIPPGQILFASDIPYGRTVAAACVVLRAALAVGLSADQIAAIAGGQLERLLAGADPLDLGLATNATPPAPGPLLERIHTLLVAAIARMTTGERADEYLELARLACDLPPGHPHVAVADSVVALLDRYDAHRATDPPQHGPRPPGIHLIFVAAAVARMPGLPLPDPGLISNPSGKQEEAVGDGR
jgi:uncharacterized protein